jgi:hypothetical protein
VTELFSQSPWPGMALWTALYVSDYALTITCARMYGTQNLIAYEGSFELTPGYQADVNALRRVSPKFIAALCITSCLWWTLWLLAARTGFRELYEVPLGALVLAELAVHVRHLRNWFLFSAIVNGKGVEGRVSYPRAFILKASAVELLGFAGLYAILFFLSGSWFLMGGAVKCASLALQHAKLARQHTKDLAGPSSSRVATST